jgi:tripartite-type tricarboxylate transporter receptor subunit TctC
MPNVLIIKGDSPIKSLAELVAFCKANPARANFSSAGSGTSSHLSGLLFGMRMGIEVTHVPYRGTAPSMAAGRRSLQVRADSAASRDAPASWPP